MRIEIERQENFSHVRDKLKRVMRLWLFLSFIAWSHAVTNWPKTVFVHHKTNADAANAAKYLKFHDVNVRVSSVLPRVTIWQFTNHDQDGVRFIIATLTSNRNVEKVEGEITFTI